MTGFEHPASVLGADEHHTPGLMQDGEVTETDMSMAVHPSEGVSIDDVRMNVLPVTVPECDDWAAAYAGDACVQQAAISAWPTLRISPEDVP